MNFLKVYTANVFPVCFHNDRKLLHGLEGFKTS